MKKTTIAALSTLVFALGGCATNAITSAEATFAPANQVFFQSVDAPDAATVMFIRDSGLNNGGLYQHVSINEFKAASLNPGEKVELKLPPGEYLFSVIPTNVMGQFIPSTVEQRVEPKKYYQYRIATSANGTTQLLRVLGRQ